VAGLTASWRAEGSTDSAPVAADGSFSIRITTLNTAEALLVDGPEPRAYHPSLFPFRIDQAQDAKVVMVPRSWTIRRGIYAGQTVPISLDVVMEDTSFGLSYYRGQVFEDL
jgi:hypothetical protein